MPNKRVTHKTTGLSKVQKKQVSKMIQKGSSQMRNFIAGQLAQSVNTGSTTVFPLWDIDPQQRDVNDTCLMYNTKLDFWVYNPDLSQVVPEDTATFSTTKYIVRYAIAATRGHVAEYDVFNGEISGAVSLKSSMDYKEYTILKHGYIQFNGLSEFNDPKSMRRSLNIKYKRGNIPYFKVQYPQSSPDGESQNNPEQAIKNRLFLFLYTNDDDLKVDYFAETYYRTRSS